MKAKLHFVSLPLICALAAACGAPTTSEQERKDAYTTTTTVVGVDRTEGWNQMTAAALHIAEQYTLNATPGDSVIVRWISDRSYDLDQQVLRISIPVVNIPPRPSTYDHARLREYKEALRKQKQLERDAKLRAVETLRGQCAGATNSTDIFGFVERATEILSSEDETTRKRMVIVSDLNDNRNFESAARLNGVHVEIYFFSTNPDPAKSREQRQYWRGLLEHMGSASIAYPQVTVEAIPENSCNAMYSQS